MPTLQTTVTTHRAGRYLSQLCVHLEELDQLAGRSHVMASSHPGDGVCSVERTQSHAVIEFAHGRCELTASDDDLCITLTADDASSLENLRQMLTTRLVTIGRRDGLALIW